MSALSSQRRNSAEGRSPAMKWKETRAVWPSGRSEMVRLLISPALASRRGDGARELDHAEVEVDDEDPLAGVEDREAAAGGDDAGERQFLVLDEAPGQAVVEDVPRAGDERRLGAPEDDDVVGELVGAGQSRPASPRPCPSRRRARPRRWGGARSAPRRPRSRRSRGRAGSGRRRAGSRRRRPRSRPWSGSAAAATAARRGR